MPKTSLGSLFEFSRKLIDILKKDNVLLTGGAGVGKSYLVGEVVSALRKVGKQVVVLVVRV